MALNSRTPPSGECIVVTVPLGAGASAADYERAVFSVISVIELAAESVLPFRASMFGVRSHTAPEHRGLARSHITIVSAAYGPDLVLELTVDWVHGHAPAIIAAAIAITEIVQPVAATFDRLEKAGTREEYAQLHESILGEVRTRIVTELRGITPVSLTNRTYLPVEATRIIDARLVRDIGAHPAIFRPRVL
jgi:hypothetical protein